MEAQFETYRPRTIHALQPVQIHDWKIKVYSISREEDFTSFSTLDAALEKLPEWITEAEKSQIPTYKTAFLIIHQAREGVWLLLNWWTGGEMIESKVFFADYSSSKTIRPSPYNTSSLLCVWELEIFAHERAAWIKHILNQPSNPDFENYLKDTLTQ